MKLIRSLLINLIPAGSSSRLLSETFYSQIECAGMRSRDGAVNGERARCHGLGDLKKSWSWRARAVSGGGQNKLSDDLGFTDDIALLPSTKDQSKITEGRRRVELEINRLTTKVTRS